MRYFYSELAGRPLTGGGVTINFEKTCIIGSNICGIYATGDENELALLNGAVQQGMGVIETSQEDYEKQQAQKKTTQFSQPYLTSKAEPLQARPLPYQIKERPGVESVANPEALKSSEIRAGKVENTESVIKVDKVASPSLVQEEQRTAKVGPRPVKTVKTNVTA